LKHDAENLDYVSPLRCEQRLATDAHPDRAFALYAASGSPRTPAPVPETYSQTSSTAAYLVAHEHLYPITGARPNMPLELTPLCSPDAAAVFDGWISLDCFPDPSGPRGSCPGRCGLVFAWHTQ
jgi:hypothetical protein